MSYNNALETALLDLVHELQGANIKLIVGGGFGIYLRVDWLLKEDDLSTLISALHWPEARSTNDLDLFLRTELFVDTTHLKHLGDALKRLGYKPIETAKYYQFEKSGVSGLPTGNLKIDLLAGPRETFRKLGIKTDNRRVRPKPAVDLHAHPVDEVPSLENGLALLPIEGVLSSGAAARGEVYLPHPFSFLTMKLHAFRDLREIEEKDYARHHALDLYMIVGSIREMEWQECLGYRDQFKGHDVVVESSRIVKKHFSEERGQGIIRLKESAYFRSDLDVSRFMSALGEIFPGPK